MKDKKFLSTKELAKILDISRVAVYKRIKTGEIKAIKVGCNFVIDRKDLKRTLDGELTNKQKLEIEEAVRRTVREYGKTLKLLSTK